jgi:hypothetical protein
MPGIVACCRRHVQLLLRPPELYSKIRRFVRRDASPQNHKEKRAMNLHEYQSKRLFAEYGIPVPRGIAVKSPNAAYRRSAMSTIPA